MAIDTIYLAELDVTPFTAGYTVIEKVVGKDMPKPKSILTKEQLAKFEAWAKEDWIKDDPYACMWDKNWITKYKDGTCK
jgi:hypothetical protein